MPDREEAAGRRPVPSDCSSTRSSVPAGPATAALAGAGLSRSRSISPASRAARRPAQSGAAAARARGVVQRGPAVEVGGQPGEQRGGAVRRERRPGQFALRLEAGGDRLVLVLRDGRRHRLADRDERGPPRHLQQRQPGSGRGGDQRRGTSSWPTPTPKPSPTTPGAGQPAYVPRSAPASSTSSFMPVVSSSSPPSRYGPGSSSSLVCTQRTAGVSRSAAGEDGQLERRVVHEGREGGGHRTWSRWVESAGAGAAVRGRVGAGSRARWRAAGAPRAGCRRTS